MKTRFIIWSAIMVMALNAAYGQKTDPTYKRYFIGSSLFMLGNFIPDDPNAPDFVQLNLGYRLTPVDVVKF
jgi:hypothetical protein